MIETNPIVGAARADTSSAPATSRSSTSSISELGPDAFITLLTAQLQAQDPLNPMDPNQMVTELTSMNTLQETIQIRQDLDALAAAAKQAPASGTGTTAASTLAAPALSQTGSTNSTPPVAAAAMSKGLVALVQSMTPGASTVSSLSNLKSRIF